MNILDKLRGQPEYVKKMILWGLIAVVGLGLLIWWIRSSYWKIKKFPKEEFIEKMNLPTFEEELPKIEMPETKEQ